MRNVERELEADVRLKADANLNPEFPSVLGELGGSILLSLRLGASAANL